MNVSGLVHRPRRYEFEDGVQELALGLMGIATASVFLAAAFLPLWYTLFPMQALWLASAFGMRWAIKRLKERVTYPRGGYVAFEQQTVTLRSRRTWLVIVYVTGIAIVTTALPPATHWPVIFSAVFVGVYGGGAIRYRIPHWWGLAAFSALLGAWVYLRDSGLTFVLLWQGVAMAAAGGLRLWRFLQFHPPIEAET